MSLNDEIRLWLKDWRIFLLKIPKAKADKVYWFWMSTLWVAAWVVFVGLIILAILD